jgi:hypothetical protein
VIVRAEFDAAGVALNLHHRVGGEEACCHAVRSAFEASIRTAAVNFEDGNCRVDACFGDDKFVR